MQNPSLSFKIEMFGNLIEELNYWHLANEDDNGVDMQFAEDRFMECLRAVRDMREILLIELSQYEQTCKLEEVPIDLGYFRIKKQLQESTFQLVRS